MTTVPSSKDASNAGYHEWCANWPNPGHVTSLGVLAVVALLLAEYCLKSFFYKERVLFASPGGWPWEILNSKFIGIEHERFKWGQGAGSLERWCFRCNKLGGLVTRRRFWDLCFGKSDFRGNLRLCAHFQRYYGGYLLQRTTFRFCRKRNLRRIFR